MTIQVRQRHQLAKLPISPNDTILNKLQLSRSFLYTVAGNERDDRFSCHFCETPVLSTHVAGGILYLPARMKSLLPISLLFLDDCFWFIAFVTCRRLRPRPFTSNNGSWDVSLFFNFSCSFSTHSFARFFARWGRTKLRTKQWQQEGNVYRITRCYFTFFFHLLVLSVGLSRSCHTCILTSE